MNSHLNSSQSPEILVRVENVSKKFCRSLKKSLWYGARDIASEFNPFSNLATDTEGRLLRPGEFLAVNDVSFELARGSCLGLVGRNGAGKTTLLKMLNGLIKPDRGRIEIRGKVGALIALGAGFNPVLSGRENVYVNASILGISKSQVDRSFDGIVDFAEIGEFIDSPVQSYSSGMQVRLGFAIASALKPDLLILDEILAVGDASFRAKCFRRLGEISRDSAVIFVSHDMTQVSRICNEALLLDGGRAVFKGDTPSAIHQYSLSKGRDERAGQCVTNEEIIDATLVRAGTSEEVISGGSCELIIKIQSTRELPVGLALINIANRSERIVAQANISKDFRKIPRGISELRISLGPLALVSGEYVVNFAVFDRSRRETLIHMTNARFLDINGPVDLGSPCLVECKVELGIFQDS
ncbi:MAG: ABC transporter ATP-binding protein [Aureliella sp.]